MHVYSFDLGDFEQGSFTATRFPANTAVSGDWVCVARDDAHALELARRASADEWHAPTSRDHDDFTVDFVAIFAKDDERGAR